MAREAEVELIDEMRTQGAGSGGSDKTEYVYAYKITQNTKE